MPIVVVRRRVVTVRMPVEGIVRIMLVGKRRVAGWRDRRRWGGDHAAGVAAQRSEISIGAIRICHLRRFLFDVDNGGRDGRGWSRNVRRIGTRCWRNCRG